MAIETHTDKVTEVKCKISLRDMLAATTYLFLSDRKRLKEFVFLIFKFWVFLLILTSFGFSVVSDYIFMIFFVVLYKGVTMTGPFLPLVILATLFLLYLAHLMQSVSFFNGQKKEFEQLQVRIAMNGVFLEGGQDQNASDTEEEPTVVPWERVFQVSENNEYVIISFSRDQSIPIPKDAFGSLSRADKFAAEARAYWRVSRGKIRSESLIN